MLERSQQQRLAFEVADRFFVLRRIEMRLDHLLHRARCVAEIAILGEINRAHAAAADASHNLVAGVQDGAPIELLDGRLMTAGGSLVRDTGSALNLHAISSEPPREADDIGWGSADGRVAGVDRLLSVTPQHRY